MSPGLHAAIGKLMAEAGYRLVGGEQGRGRQTDTWLASTEPSPEAGPTDLVRVEYRLEASDG